jgi:uncharacterized protein YdiU (UPF0061 family)
MPVPARENCMMSFKVWRMAAFSLCLSAVCAHAQPSGPGMLDSLHGSLKLSSSQEGAWQALKNAYASDPQEMSQRRAAMDTMRTLGAPQRVDLSIKLMKDDLESLQRRGEALKAFYATLSPQQQAIFDRDTLPGPPGRD